MSGKKFDGLDGNGPMKRRWDLMPWTQLEQVVDVITHGAIKYGPGNWMQLDGARDRYFAAAMRHLSSWRQGESIDPDSDLPHLAHALCSILFLSWFDTKGVADANAVRGIHAVRSESTVPHRLDRMLLDSSSIVSIDA